MAGRVEGAVGGELCWRDLVALDELPADGGGLVREVAGRRLAVFRGEAGVHVLDDECPHQGASLGLGVARDGEVACPWHSLHFRLTDGSSGDGLDECVAVHPARLTAAGRVEVGLRSPG